LAQIAESIRQFGFINPILIDGDGGVIAGHGRLAAAKLLRMDQVPAIRLDEMDETQKRAYILADNKLAENAGWDRDLLALELEYLTELELDFDISVVGFETAEIDLLIEEIKVSKTADKAEQLPAVDPASSAISEPGDLWLLGKHRLLCADATKAESFVRLLDGARAQMIFTTPYNTTIDDNVCASGGIRNFEFTKGPSETSETELTNFLATSLCLLADYSADGSIHFICLDWRHMVELLAAGGQIYGELLNLCVWNKGNGGLGSLYRSAHELVFVFKRGNAKHIHNTSRGRFGRNRTNVWDYPRVDSLHHDRRDDRALHPKPVALVADAIRDSSRRDGIVLDSFGGNGTTLIAAHETGRRGYLIERDPSYVDVTIKRYEKLTGEMAIHAETGCAFDELKHQRAGLRGMGTVANGDAQNG
jgi:hypothetical protein